EASGDVVVADATQTVDVALSPIPVPAVGAPVPTQDPADVISLFSDTYTDVTVDTWRTDWSSGVLEDVTIDSNPAKKYSDLDFVGIETGASPVDASGMTHVHIDIWTPNMTQFGLKLVDFGADASYGGGDDVEHQINVAAPAQEEWVSLDIPFTEFTGLTTRSHLAQYILVGQPTESSIVYIDNFYFYYEDPGTTYTTTFSVTDGTDPLEAATVTISGQTLTTDASGIATVDLANGTYAYTVSLEGYDEVTGSVEVADATQTVDVVLSETVYTGPTVAAPNPPVRNPGDVISIYSDAYTNVNGTNFNPPWGQSTVMTIDSIGDNGMLTYANFNYQGTTLAASQNVSIMDTLHVDVYTADADTARIFCISSGPVEKSFTLQLTANEWNSFDIPLSEFSDVVDLNDVFQIKFDGGDGSQTLYIDNLYFYREAGIITYNVTFTVTDGTDPINGANVAINSQTLVTDASGVASVYLENGTYDYTVSSSGYEGASGSVTVADADEAVSVELVADLSPQAAAPAPPVRDPENVMSIFSEAYDNIANVNFNPNWGQSTLVDIVLLGDNNDSTLRYRNFNYQGTELGGNFDMSAMEYLHIDMWTADATVVKVSPISGGGEYLYSLTPMPSGNWQSYDIPLSEFTDNGVTLNDIFQMKFDAQAGETPCVIYLDNIYFYKIPSGPTSTVTFNVTDGTDPIEGAVIDIASQSVTTDASGVATVELEDGVYGYSVNATNYEEFTGNVIVEGADITVDVSMTVGIGSVTENIANVYPNPAYNTITVAIDELPANATMQLVDLTGRVIYNSNVTATNTTLNLTNYSEGTYILMINSNQGIVSKHLIIKK
ncbi:MAG: hypothetical protein C0599_10945, partial [Salinivirgaceae bacterium]